MARAPDRRGVPIQFVARAVALVVGLVLLFVVGVHGAALYGASALIALAVLTEVTATLVYWRRSRR